MSQFTSVFKLSKLRWHLITFPLCSECFFSNIMYQFVTTSAFLSLFRSFFLFLLVYRPNHVFARSSTIFAIASSLFFTAARVQSSISSICSLMPSLEWTRRWTWCRRRCLQPKPQSLRCLSSSPAPGASLTTATWTTRTWPDRGEEPRPASSEAPWASLLTSPQSTGENEKGLNGLRPAF